MSAGKRVALLVDGENMSADHAEFAVQTAEGLGTAIIRRVYGNLGKTGRWAGMPGFRSVHTPSGKNIGDISLSLDALELALTGQADSFVLATSDRDLALVALRLRELGFRVTGIGEEQKVAPEFREACRAFVAVPDRPRTGAGAPKQAEPPQRPPFELRLKAFMLREGAASDGWVPLNMLGQARAKADGISKADAGIGKSASWFDWFAKRPAEFEVEKRGTDSRARLVRTRP
jgi:uncharacterized LabA/DUF88 family protein